MRKFRHKQTGTIAEDTNKLGWYRIIGAECQRYISNQFIENTNDWEEITKPVFRYKIDDWIKVKDVPNAFYEYGKIVAIYTDYAINPSYQVEMSNGILCNIAQKSIKCKVKPVELWANIYKNIDSGDKCVDGGIAEYCSGVLYTVEKKCYVESQLHCSNHIQQNKITIYEEVE